MVPVGTSNSRYKRMALAVVRLGAGAEEPREGSGMLLRRYGSLEIIEGEGAAEGGGRIFQVGRIRRAERTRGAAGADVSSAASLFRRGRITVGDSIDCRNLILRGEADWKIGAGCNPATPSIWAK